MFKKNEETKNIEELNKSEFVKVDIEFSRTQYGKKLNRLTMLPAIMTVFSSVYVFTSGVANGYIDIANIGILLMIGLGLTSIARMIYFQSLARYYNHLKEKK